MKRQGAKRSPTFKSPKQLNNSQDALLMFSPPSSMREIGYSFRSNLHRNATLISRRGKLDQQDDQTQPNRHFRTQLQKQYEESFIKQLLDRALVVNRMNTYQKQVLDDLQFGSDTQVDDIDNACYKFMFNYFNNYPVIKQQGNFKIIWNLIMLLNLISIFIWLPYKLAFGLTKIMQLFDQNSGSLTIEYTNIIILALDIFITVNQAYIHKGKIINQRYHIMSHYLQTDFLIDLICLCSLAYLFVEKVKITELEIILSCLFGTIKSAKIYQIFQQIQEYFNTHQQNTPIVVANTTTLLYLIHLIACIQYSLIKDEELLLQGRNMQNQYMYCLNWAAAYLTSVGSTSIFPENNQQLIFSSFVSLLSILINAFITIRVAFFAYKQYNNTKHSQYVTMMNNFMALNNINFDLQYRIRSYLDFICKAEQSMFEEDVSTVTHKLSEQLRSELKYQLQANILEQCKLISHNFSFKFRKQLVHYMEEVKSIPEQRIVTLDQVDDSSIYLINKGEVTLLFEEINNMSERHPRNQIKTLAKGDHFGFHSFITANPRTTTVISKGFCQLYKIKRIHFVNLLEQFPDDKEIFYMIKDTIQIGQDLSSLDIKCYGCKSTKHMVNKCPFLHYEPDRDRVIKQQLYPVLQERDDPIVPRKSKYINALLQRQLISDIAMELMEHLENIKKSEDVSESDSESNSKSVQTLSNIQSKSYTKSMSQYSNQLSRFSRRPSQTLTIPLSQIQSMKSQEEIGKFEQELMKKSTFSRKIHQQETAGFGAQFHSQMHNPIHEKDEEIPQYPKDEEEEQDFPKNQHHSDRSPRIARRVSQRVTFDQNIFAIKGRRSSFVYDTYLQQLAENNHQLITQPSVGDFDKMVEFRKYFPQHNISHIVKQLQQPRGFQKPIVSLYSFFYTAIQKGNAMKRKPGSKVSIKLHNQARKNYKQLLSLFLENKK